MSKDKNKSKPLPPKEAPKPEPKIEENLFDDEEPAKEEPQQEIPASDEESGESEASGDIPEELVVEEKTQRLVGVHPVSLEPVYR